MENDNWENDKARWRKARAAGSMPFVEHMPQFIDALLSELDEKEKDVSFWRAACRRVKEDAEFLAFAAQTHREVEKANKEIVAAKAKLRVESEKLNRLTARAQKATSRRRKA